MNGSTLPRLAREATVVAAALLTGVGLAWGNGPPAGEPARLQPPSLGGGLRAGPAAFEAPAGPAGVTLPRRGRTVEATPNRFVHRHLMPRLSRRLGGMAPFDVEETPTWSLADPGADQFRSDALVPITQRHVEKGTLSAVKDYLVEISTLDRIVDSLRDRRRSRGPADVAPERVADDAGPGKRTSFRLGGSHGAPKVEMRYRVGDGAQMRLHVTGRGSAGFEFRGGRRSWTHIRLEYDAREGEYGLACRFLF